MSSYIRLYIFVIFSVLKNSIDDDGDTPTNISKFINNFLNTDK